MRWFSIFVMVVFCLSLSVANGQGLKTYNFTNVDAKHCYVTCLMNCKANCDDGCNGINTPGSQWVSTACVCTCPQIPESW
jgi:hypothetical protein